MELWSVRNATFEFGLRLQPHLGNMSMAMELAKTARKGLMAPAHDEST
jgi:hypothetical protein